MGDRAMAADDERAARRRALREEERTRLARELHDGLGQTLTRIKLDLNGAVRAVESGDLAGATDLLHAAIAAIDASTDAVRRISSDLCPAALDHLGLHAAMAPASGPSPYETLSDREYQVFRMIASGHTVSQIAVKMGISVKTVSTYRARLLEKLRLKTNAEVMRHALREGLVD